MAKQRKLTQQQISDLVDAASEIQLAIEDIAEGGQRNADEAWRAYCRDARAGILDTPEMARVREIIGRCANWQSTPKECITALRAEWAAIERRIDANA